jgi:hypothetical protein
MVGERVEDKSHLMGTMSILFRFRLYIRLGFSEASH